MNDMGFRSVMITAQPWYEIPDWFLTKYPDLGYGYFNMPTLSFGTQDRSGPAFPISVRMERKFYNDVAETELFLDIQKVLIELAITELVLILLHECDGITRVKITHDSITAREPVEWREVERVEHDYCYKCSDV